MPELDMKVEATSDCRIERTRELLLDRLARLSDGLQWLIDNGVEAERPADITSSRVSIQMGVCRLVRACCEDAERHVMPYSFEISRLLEKLCREIIGEETYPLDVVPDISAHDQYNSFYFSVGLRVYNGLTRDQFNDYANARIALIAGIVEGVKNAKFKRDRGVYVKI